MRLKQPQHHVWLHFHITFGYFIVCSPQPSGHGDPATLQVMANLISGGYHVVTRSYLFPDHDRLLMEGEFSREQLACVDYYLALESSFFIGNSVSSFSAMLLLERQRQGTWASYYNGGNVPMSVALPLFHLPWVFTYNSWSAKYDYMLKAAVRSGLDQGMLKPYCLFAGDATAPIVAWLEVSSTSGWAPANHQQCVSSLLRFVFVGKYTAIST